MSTTMLQASRINLPKVPSYRAAHKYARLSEEQQDYIFRNSRKTLVLGWLALFGSDIKEQDEALTSLIKYCYTAVHRPYLPDRFIDTAVHDVLAAFTGMSEQEALEFEQRTHSLQYITNRITSRAIDFHRHQTNTVKGNIERNANSLSILDSDSAETQKRLEIATDVALAVSTGRLESASEIKNALIKTLFSRKARLIQEFNDANAEGGNEAWIAAIAILRSPSVQWCIEFSDSMQKLDAAVTLALARNLQISEGHARRRKKVIRERMMTVINRTQPQDVFAQMTWARIYRAPDETVGESTVSATHHVNRGRKKVTTKMLIGSKGAR